LTTAALGSAPFATNAILVAEAYFYFANIG